MNFTDRLLKCSDCGQDFVFTAGEQLFFFDKQFKNDPKRCKLCKAKRAGLGRTAGPNGAVALPLSRTETKTQCSSCGVETTVPFKPTQGRPVLCRSCFQMKRVPPAVAAAAALDSPTEQIALQSKALEEALGAAEAVSSTTVSSSSPENSASTMGALSRLPEFRSPLMGFEEEAEPMLAGCVAERS